MTSQEAEKLVQSYLNAQVEGYSIMPEATMEAPSCFAVFYQTDTYIKSRRFSDMAVGQGPTIVSKTNGELFHTGSGRFVEDSIASFEKYGDPYKEKDTSKIILSFNKKAVIDLKPMMLLVKRVTGKGIMEAKEITADLINGGTIQLENSFSHDDLDELNNHGFVIDHPFF